MAFGDTLTCKLDTCGKTFRQLGYRGQRPSYCCDNHRKTASKRRKKANNESNT